MTVTTRLHDVEASADILHHLDIHGLQGAGDIKRNQCKQNTRHENLSISFESNKMFFPSLIRYVDYNALEKNYTWGY